MLGGLDFRSPWTSSLMKELDKQQQPIGGVHVNVLGILHSLGDKRFIRHHEQQEWSILWEGTSDTTWPLRFKTIWGRYHLFPLGSSRFINEPFLSETIGDSKGVALAETSASYSLRCGVKTAEKLRGELRVASCYSWVQTMRNKWWGKQPHWSCHRKRRAKTVVNYNVLIQQAEYNFRRVKELANHWLMRGQLEVNERSITCLVLVWQVPGPNRDGTGDSWATSLTGR